MMVRKSATSHTKDHQALFSCGVLNYISFASITMGKCAEEIWYRLKTPVRCRFYISLKGDIRLMKRHRTDNINGGVMRESRNIKTAPAVQQNVSGEKVVSAKSAGEKTGEKGKQGLFSRTIGRLRTVFSDDGFTQKAQTVGAYSAAFMAAFLVALISASAFTPLDNTEASDTINATLSGSGYNITINTTGTSSEGTTENGVVSLNITPTADGAISVGKDTVNVITNSHSYKVYVSMASDNTNSRLNLGGSSTATAYFSPVAGTTAVPIALTNNTWGWALAESGGISGYAFDNVYTMSNGAASDGTSGNSLDTTQKFAAMPSAGSEALIAAGTDATSSSGVNYDVYYGAKATTALQSGSYSGTVVYTAIGEATDATAGAASIAPEVQTSEKTSQTVVITTSLYVSSGLDLGNVSVTIGGETCTGPTTSIDQTSGTVNITCTAPALTWGDYDVVATFTKFDRAYKIAKGYSVYIPYATIQAGTAGQYPMQGFTSRTCNEITTPAAFTSGTSVLSGGVVNTSVPEFTLKDSRDNSTYRIRKLADGNCWMTQNLRLKLKTATALNSETSDINYNMDTGEGVDGSTTTTRTISNNLSGTSNPLGTYSTNSSTGVISWTPFMDSQTGYSIAWGSPYTSASGTKATSGTSASTSVKHFGMDGKTIETESAAYYVNNNAYSEYARSYDNEGNSQSGTGTGAGNLKIQDEDGNAQFYGTYYNWYAATAGSGTYAMTNTGGNAQNSVCPKNWELPRNDGNKSWYNLLTTKFGMSTTGNASTTPALQDDITKEINATKKAPFSVLQAGAYHWAYGSLYDRGSGAYYWASAANSQTYARDLGFYALQNFYPQYTDYKIYGLTVRCVAR